MDNRANTQSKEIQGQNVLLKKLTDYLKYLYLSKDRDRKIIAKHKNLISKLDDSSRLLGVCYALCLIRGAMRATGKLKWWENALAMIINWDGSYDEFKQKITLPDSKAEITLENLLERVLNYLLVYQGLIESLARNPVMGIYGNPKFKSSSMPFFNQRDITDPRQPYFEIVGEKGEIKTVEERYIDNVFSKNKLEEFLPHMAPVLESDANIIFTLRKDEHELELTYSSGEWILYDPNYDHTKPENMVKVFKTDNIKELIEEIHARCKIQTK